MTTKEIFGLIPEGSREIKRTIKTSTGRGWAALLKGMGIAAGQTLLLISYVWVLLLTACVIGFVIYVAAVYLISKFF